MQVTMHCALLSLSHSVLRKPLKIEDTVMICVLGMRKLRLGSIALKLCQIPKLMFTIIRNFPSLIHDSQHDCPGLLPNILSIPLFSLLKYHSVSKAHCLYEWQK